MNDDVWPLQILKLRQALSALPPGCRFRTVVSEPDREVLLRFIERAGHSVLSDEPAGPGHIALTIAKGEDRPT